MKIEFFRQFWKMLKYQISYTIRLVAAEMFQEDRQKL